MDWQTISTLVGSLGFPIVCCGFLAYYMSTTLKDFQKIIEKNTIALTELTMMLRKDNNDND